MKTSLANQPQEFWTRVARNIVVLGLCGLYVGLAAAGHAQEATSTKALKEINRDIWVPFMQGVAASEDALYLGTRSKDYVRVQANGRLILDHANYVDDTVTMMGRYRDQGAKVVLDVRFDERITDGRHASERGITRVIFTPKSGDARTSYTRFHVISRKEGAAWRVLTDYAPADSASEAEYQRAKAPDDVQEFRCHMPYPEKKLRCE
jgi:hypothetical protein